MKWSNRGERGQAMVEFAIIFFVFMMLTTGLVDVGRAFYQYNALSSAARFGARWAAVVGGTCDLQGANSTDWCNQQGKATGGFWTQSGNVPLQGANAPCPSYSANPAAYYSAADPDNDADNDYSASGDTDGGDGSGNSTTIVGTVDQHFDTSSTSSNFIVGAIGGFDLTNLKVCIQTTAPPAVAPNVPVPSPGDYVRVVLHYHFNPVSFILARASFNLDATSEYEIQG